MRTARMNYRKDAGRHQILFVDCYSCIRLLGDYGHISFVLNL